MAAAALAMAAARGSKSPSRFFKSTSAARRAERGPKPGNFARSWISLSISSPAGDVATSASTLTENARRQAHIPRELAHLLRHALLELGLGIAMCGDDEIFKNFAFVFF